MNTLISTMTCTMCGTFTAAVDCLCAECRKKKYDTGGCSRCGKLYDDRDGWTIASFESYIDIASQCPECQVEVKVIDNRLEDIKQEIARLRSEIKSTTSYVRKEGEDYYPEVEGISFSEFIEAIKDYVLREDEINEVIKHNKRINANIADLSSESRKLESLRYKKPCNERSIKR